MLSERNAQDPVFPYKLLKNRYYLAILMLMFIFSVLNSAANYLPSYVQTVLGTSSTVSGHPFNVIYSLIEKMLAQITV